MDILQRLRVGGVFRLQIHDLSADHAIHRAGGARDLFDDAHPRLRRTLQPRQHFVGLGLQRIAGENRDRLAKRFVACGTPAAQVVIVERGQVVMDQRVGVQHLQRRAQFFDFRRQRSRDHAAGSMQRTGRSRLPPAKTLWRMAL